MTSVLRRNACPSLSEPMETGDGLLVRLHPRDGSLAPHQLAGIADAARRCGNGIIEITARGNLQIRGLTSSSVERLRAAIESLAIDADTGIEIRTNPLAGRDPSAIADPRPLAGEIRRRMDTRGIVGRLAPKVSVTVDGGGTLDLSSLSADVKLEAVATEGNVEWAVRVGGDSWTASYLGQGSAEYAVDVAIDALTLLAAPGAHRRGRDLDGDALATLGSALHRSGEPVRHPSTIPVGLFPLSDGTFARGFALPFGQTGSSELAALADALDPACAFRLAPSRGLLALGLSCDACDRLSGIADGLGFVTRPDDLRLRIAACAGSPSCASAHLPTKAIANALVDSRPDLLASLPAVQVSGCIKQCARPAGPSLSLIGLESGCDVVADGLEPGSEIRNFLLRLADAHRTPAKRRSA
ncbi:MAG: precorrin-3B synthase [Dongiaceae bacterium]